MSNPDLLCGICGKRHYTAVALDACEDSHKEGKRCYWRAKLVKDGPYIPVMTWNGPPLIDGEEQDRSPRWQALVRLETTGRVVLTLGDGNSPVEIEGETLRNIEPIKERDYEFMKHFADWATKHRPDLPVASPKQAIDRNKIKPAI